MTRSKRNTYKFHEDDELLEIAKNYDMLHHLKKNNASLYGELKRRSLLDKVVLNPDFVYVHSLTKKKEDRINEIYKKASKYDNYEDFKNDEELYKECFKRKMINKIKENFKKVDIFEKILKESESYENYKDFMSSVWYRKAARFKGFTDRIKNHNGWEKYKTPKKSYVASYPHIVEYIKSKNCKVSDLEISKNFNIHKSMAWKIKKEMKNLGLFDSSST
jgi:hypothetical protein